MIDRQLERVKQLNENIPDCDALVHLERHGSRGFTTQDVLVWVNAPLTVDAWLHDLQLHALRGTTALKAQPRPARDTPPESLLWIPALWCQAMGTGTGYARAIGTKGIHLSLNIQPQLPTIENACNALTRGILLAMLQPGGPQLPEAQTQRLLELSGADGPDALTLMQLAVHWLTHEVAREWGSPLPDSPGTTVSRLAFRQLRDTGSFTPVNALPSQFDPLGWIGAEHLWNLPPGMASAVLSEARARLSQSSAQSRRRGLSTDWQYRDTWHLIECLREGSPGLSSARRQWNLRQSLEDFFSVGGVILPHDAAFIETLEQRTIRHNLDYGLLPDSYLLSPGLLSSRDRHEQASLIRQTAMKLKVF